MSLIPGLPARDAALELLGTVLERGQPLELDLPALTSQDRAFAHLLAKTTLRRLGQCDALIAAWMEKPLAPKLRNVHNILRLGITQLLWLDTPPHAAVHLAVEQAKRHNFVPQAGLVNAMLNRAVREGKQAITQQDEALLNTPAWLWESWVAAYGEEKTRERALAHLQEPPLHLSVKENPESWAKKLGGALLPNGTICLENAGAITQLPGFAEGAWWVQDAAAATPVRMLGDVKGKTVLDICAAPGGKTAQLCAAGANVIAVDRSESRMKILRENLARLRMQAECVVADAATWQPKAAPDAILLDAPCSATGTIRRHPDVAYLRKPADIERLVIAQERLLAHAWEILPLNGILAYAVCSMQPEEGIMQVQRLCTGYKNVKQLGVYLPFQETSSQDGDGFFVGLLEKTRD